MLKIGDFSKLAHVTVKTLRYYDRLRLLKPVWVDRYSGYRYYELDQLGRLNRILALKDMGFSLEQVAVMLQDNLTVDQLRRLFDQKQRELQARLVDQQARLARVADRIRQIEYEGSLPEEEVTLKTVPPLVVASLRGRIVGETGFPSYFHAVQEVIVRWVEAAKLPSRDQWLVIRHNPAYQQRDVDIEVALVLEDGSGVDQVPDEPAVVLRWLPAVERMACILHPTDKDNLRGHSLQVAYRTLYQWIDCSGYFLAGPAREVFLQDPAADRGDMVHPESRYPYVEIQLPVQNRRQIEQELYAVPNRKENEMEPKIVTLPAFTVAGLRYYGDNKNQEIRQLWGEFNQRAGELEHVTADSPAYGVCITDPEAKAGEFEYVAAYQVDRTDILPVGMVAREIPASKYAVFTHVGSLEKLSDTYQYIYQVWLPQSGYQTAGGLDFELYDDEFKDFAPDSRFYIYVPVR